jgi:hypothetical protein
MSENPFEVLRLSPDATPEAAVRQAARLAQVATDEASRNQIRQAIQELTASPEAWTLAALLTHPRPEHANAELERFIAAHRRPPASTAAEIPIPGVDWQEVRTLLIAVLADEQRVPPLPLERIEVSESAAEIERQTAEAVWQGLVAQMGG